MQFCNIESDSGSYISDMLANSVSGLEILNLAGNRLGGQGLTAICQGLIQNIKLHTLSLADNMIEQSDDDIEGLEALRNCLLLPTNALESIDLMFNRIGNFLYVFTRIFMLQLG